MIKLPRKVKRVYASPLRDEQARATRTAIIDAAGALFADQGYAGVSVDAIAKAAGVGRATVFTSVGGKPELLKCAYRAAFARAAGGGEGIALVDRPRAAEIHAQRTARAYLASYTALARDICIHLSRINEAVREAAGSDAEVRELFDASYAERRRGGDRIVAEVRKRAPLRKGLEPHAAADIVWVLNDPSVFFLLVHRRGWTAERYEAWLVRALESELLGA